MFPSYITDKIVQKSLWIVPGQVKMVADSTLDYSMASGHLSYRLSKFTDLQFGTDKNFIRWL